jgi:Flp pilus assembly protein TadG
MMIARNKTGKRRGIVWTVEAAVVLPLLLLVFFAVFEYARFLFTVQMVNNAAREGARYAVTNIATASTSQVQTYVDNYMAGQGVQLQGYTPANNIKVFQANPATGQDNSGGWQNTKPGYPIGVQINGTYTPVLFGSFKLFGNTQVSILGSTTIKATCIMTSEAN